MISLLVQSYGAPGELLDSTAHEHAEGATVFRYRVNSGHILVTVWRGVVHEVIYQTPCDDDVASDQRNAGLFAHYGQGRDWKEILDNGFGKVYRRVDMQRFALWSYAMDFNTFGTMDFHHVRWR